MAARTIRRAEDPGKAYRELVGRRLRHYRTELRLNLEQAAEALEKITGRDITGAAIGMWERGENLPSLTNRFALVQMYDRSLDEVFGYTETDADREIVRLLNEKKRAVA